MGSGVSSGRAAKTSDPTVDARKPSQVQHQTSIHYNFIKDNYLTMFRALQVFLALICLVLSIQAVVTTSSDVDHVKESSVSVPVGKLPLTKSSQAASLNGPVVIANQPSAVSANLRTKEENEVDLEGM